MIGIFYYHPRIYSWAMQLLYGNYYKSRYQCISELIPENSNVADLCCGDALIYSKYLKDRVNYTGYDLHHNFVKWLNKKGIRAFSFDLQHDPIPRAECILMMGSLYHFIPDQEEILQQMIDAADKMLIVSEPIQNISDSRNSLLRKIAQWATATKKGYYKNRFNLEEMQNLFAKFGVTYVIKLERELIGIFIK